MIDSVALNADEAGHPGEFDSDGEEEAIEPGDEGQAEEGVDRNMRH